MTHRYSPTITQPGDSRPGSIRTGRRRPRFRANPPDHILETAVIAGHELPPSLTILFVVTENDRLINPTIVVQDKAAGPAIRPAERDLFRLGIRSPYINERVGTAIFFLLFFVSLVPLSLSPFPLFILEGRDAFRRGLGKITDHGSTVVIAHDFPAQSTNKAWKVLFRLLGRVRGRRARHVPGSEARQGDAGRYGVPMNAEMTRVGIWAVQHDVVRSQEASLGHDLEA